MSDRIGMKSTREAVKQEYRQELGQISEVVQAEMIHKIFIYDKVSDVPESRVWFASKNLTPCRMH